MRDARLAGENPPSTPMLTVKITPGSRSPGVTRKANAISLKLAQFVCAMRPRLRHGRLQVGVVETRDDRAPLHLGRR